VSTPSPAWRLYEVSIEGFGASVLSARSRGAAIYSRYLDFTDAYDVSFRTFLGCARARVVPGAWPDPYEYVRHYYGVDVRHGKRVAIRDEGADLEGRQGTVVHPGRDSTAYVYVVLDGDEHASIVHPRSLALLS
jgi:hypothetical protein